MISNLIALAILRAKATNPIFSLAYFLKEVSEFENDFLLVFIQICAQNGRLRGQSRGRSRSGQLAAARRLGESHCRVGQSHRHLTRRATHWLLVSGFSLIKSFLISKWEVLAKASWAVNKAKSNRVMVTRFKYVCKWASFFRESKFKNTYHTPTVVIKRQPFSSIKEDKSLGQYQQFHCHPAAHIP